MLPKEQGYRPPAETNEAMLELFHVQPAQRRGEGLEAWETQLKGLSEDPRFYLDALQDVLEVATPAMKNGSEKNWELQTVFEQRVRVLTEAAQEKGATPLEIKLVYFETWEAEMRQFVIDTWAAECDGLSHRDIGVLLDRYGLTW